LPRSSGLLDPWLRLVVDLWMCHRGQGGSWFHGGEQSRQKPDAAHAQTAMRATSEANRQPDRRHPRLPRASHVRLIRPACSPGLIVRARYKGIAAAPRSTSFVVSRSAYKPGHSDSSGAEGCWRPELQLQIPTASSRPVNARSRTSSGQGWWNHNDTPHRRAASCNRASAPTTPRSGSTSQDTSTHAASARRSAAGSYEERGQTNGPTYRGTASGSGGLVRELG